LSRSAFPKDNDFLLNKNMKLPLISAALLLAFTVSVALGQTGYEIDVTLTGLKDTSCVLGHYNHSRTSFVAKDTARADANGRMIFKGDSLPGGIYLVLLPGQVKWAEVVYSGEERQFRLVSDTTDIIGNMKVTGSRENQFFYDFQREMASKMQEIARRQSANPQDPTLPKLREEMETYRKNAINQAPQLLTSKFLKALQSPEIPPAPKLPNGKDDSTWVFTYYKAHYWDAIDFNDSRLLRTPILQPKVEQYVKNLIVQNPDSLIKEADALINRSQNKEFRQFLIRYFASEYENPKVVGTEGVFVHMAEKYYLSGEIALSDDGKKRVADRVNVLKPLLVNKKFPSLLLWDDQKKPFSVTDLTSDYTVVFFYSPTCGHCKESAPKLLEFYEKNKALGVAVVAVATENSDEEWKKFIADQHTNVLKNGYDYSNQIDFRNQFDVLSTPTIYVLNKTKQIIARKLPVEQLDDFLSFYRNRAGNKK
jgi:thiol-disulfide isomerase/thioredoxin